MAPWPGKNTNLELQNFDDRGASHQGKSSSSSVILSPCCNLSAILFNSIILAKKEK